MTSKVARGRYQVAQDVQRKIEVTEKGWQLVRHYSDENTSSQKWKSNGLQLVVSVTRCSSIGEGDDLLEALRLSPAQGISESISGFGDKAFILRSSKDMVSLMFRYGVYVVTIEGILETAERFSRHVMGAIAGK